MNHEFIEISDDLDTKALSWLDETGDTKQAAAPGPFAGGDTMARASDEQGPYAQAPGQPARKPRGGTAPQAQEQGAFAQAPTPVTKSRSGARPNTPSGPGRVRSAPGAPRPRRG